MEYLVPLTLDSELNIQGLFSIFTSSGPMVFIFTDQSKLMQFLEAASSTMAQSGKKVGSTGIEADTFDDLVTTLLQMDPSMAGNVNFLPDSDPLFAQVLSQMG